MSNSEPRALGFKHEPHNCLFSFKSDAEATADDHLAATYRLALFLGTLMWMVNMMSFNRLEGEGETLENVCAMLNHYGELSELLTDEIAHHVQSAVTLLNRKGGER
jgi:hypothetical protein